MYTCGDPVCYLCGDTLDSPALDAPASSLLCRTCRMTPPPFARAVSYGTYDGRLRAAIHALKYGGIRPAARRLGSMLASVIAQLPPPVLAEMLVVPVPLHHTKHRQRGFNQARALARSAISVLRNSHPECHLSLAPSALMRLRSTESQAGLTPRQRRHNLRGAFKVSDPAAVRGRQILLVDDILTTGATARAAAQSLMKAGAASVYVATLARARRLNVNLAQPHRAQPEVRAEVPSSSSAHQPIP
jgi:ComF family protein